MSLLIIDHVMKGLTRSSSLQHIVQQRIYPLAIPEGASMPFVVVSDAVVEPQSLTKDGGADYDEDAVMVVAVARKLGDATKVAQEVRKALQSYTGSQNGIEVDDAWLEKAQPRYNEELRAYCWELTFGFESSID